MPTAYRRATRAVWRRAHGRVLIRTAGQPEIVVLTGTGEDLWLLLDEPVTAEHLAVRLADTYRATPGEILPDLEPALADLAERGVLDRAAGD